MDLAVRLDYIMALLMRRLAPLLLALLAACQTGAPAGSGDRTIAHATGSQPTDLARSVQGKSLAPQTTGAGETQAPQGPSASSIVAPAIDTNQRREYAEVYVDLKDPSGQKGLVSYLMKPDEWHIEKVSQLTDTVKLWRFWRVARTDGKSMPEIDPLRPKPRP